MDGVTYLHINFLRLLMACAVQTNCHHGKLTMRLDARDPLNEPLLTLDNVCSSEIHVRFDLLDSDRNVLKSQCQLNCICSFNRFHTHKHIYVQARGKHKWSSVVDNRENVAGDILFGKRIFDFRWRGDKMCQFVCECVFISICCDSHVLHHFHSNIQML